MARAGRWVGWGGDGVASRDAGPDPRARPARVVSCRVVSPRGVGMGTRLASPPSTRAVRARSRGGQVRATREAIRHMRDGPTMEAY